MLPNPVASGGALVRALRTTLLGVLALGLVATIAVTAVVTRLARRALAEATGEAEQVIKLLGENGLVRGENGRRGIMRCELPTNALLADQFLEHFDGFSIGSNDLTQLTLGLDRDSGIVAHLFDERNPAVKQLMSMAIRACKAQGKRDIVKGGEVFDQTEVLKHHAQTAAKTRQFSARQSDHIAPEHPHPASRRTLS